MKEDDSSIVNVLSLLFSTNTDSTWSFCLERGEGGKEEESMSVL